MSCVDTDIELAMEALKNLTDMASAHRKEHGFLNYFATMVSSTSVDDHIKSIPFILFMMIDLQGMSPVQKHAELVFAEGYLFKAMLSLITDKNLMAFVREGMHIREAYNTINQLFKFIRHLIKDCPEEEIDILLDENGVDYHFLSGVLNGMGIFNMIFSMLPSRLLSVFEIIGFSGDRDFALTCLGKSIHAFHGFIA